MQNTDAAAKLEEQRRRNRLAQRRRRERQRNRATSISSVNNDAIAPIVVDVQDQQPAEDKTWDFAIDNEFFDSALETQDDLVDQFLHPSPPPSTDSLSSSKQTDVPTTGSLRDKSDLINGISVEMSTGLADARRESTSQDDSSSPLRQFLLTLQKGDRELAQDSYNRLIALFPQTNITQHQRSDSTHKQLINVSDFAQFSGSGTGCYSATGSSSLGGSQTFSWPRSESRPSVDSHSVDSAAQEVSFERIREFVEDAGFESLDAMMAAYYNSNLCASSNQRPTQAVGRSRRLRSFLSALHRNHAEWGDQERSAYREEIARAAEGIYADELSDMVHGATETNGAKRLSIPGSAKSSTETSRVYIAHRIQSLVSDQEMQDFMRKDRKDLQDTVAETWSLITQLIYSTGQSPQQKASTACIILYLLTSPAAT